MRMPNARDMSDEQQDIFEDAPARRVQEKPLSHS